MVGVRLRKEQKPDVTPYEHTPGNIIDRYEHPAFGTVQISRMSGDARLFDSQFKHQHYITLRINEASMDRNLSQNWIHGHNTVAEVSMSEAQFARLISSLNVGSGIPCTIRRMGGESMPDIEPMETEEQLHVREFDKHMAEVYERIDELESEIDSAKMTQKLRIKLSRMADKVRSAANSNLKFVANSFTESMESTVEAAKIEISSYAKMNGIDRPPELEVDRTLKIVSEESD